MVHGRERGGWLVRTVGVETEANICCAMSRCFPFPPPGYEIEARNNHVDQLEKGNNKEKKHKKEKRDKEKREGKERKDRDRSKDKNKDKKHRKEKHKVKKKDRDKYQNRTSDDRRNKGQTENHNEEKLRDTSGTAEEVKDSKFTEDLDRRIRDGKMGASQRMSETFSDSTQRRTENLRNLSTSANAIKKEQNNGNEMVGVDSSKEHGRINGLGRPDGNFEGQAMKGKGGKSKKKETDNRKRDKHKDRFHEEKRNKGNDNRRHKEKEKEKELVGGKDHHENKSNAKPKASWKNDQVDSPDFNPLALHTNNEKYVGPDGDINKKRKDFKINGFSHENDIQPSKIPRPAYSCHPHVENGRAMESCHIATDSSIGHQAKSNIKPEVINNVETKINGTAINQLSSVDLKPSVSLDACENGGASLKRSHADSKFLPRIYSAPEMEDWPESDGQECHIATESSIGNQVKSNCKEKVINNVENMINGRARTPLSSINLKPSVVVDTCQNGGGTLKQSHLDSKYLDQIYSVPKMEDWLESDGQECHIATYSSIGHQAKSNSKEKVINNVESKINGTARTSLSSVDLKPSVVVDTCQNGGGSLKRSHPDSKYLDQIYSVPKMEDWPESDDQEWLFDKDNPRSKIKKMNVIKETRLVWSETQLIKSADVFALPYVIPY